MKIHYSGGIVFENGNRLPGWACCGTGGDVHKIRDQGNQTQREKDVTCKACLKMLVKQEKFRADHPEIWERYRKKRYCKYPTP